MPNHPDPTAYDASDDPAGAAEADAFTTALRRAADGLPPADGRALVAAGFARGRTLRRRRAAVVTAGVAVLALAGTGGVLAAGAGHGTATGTATGVAAAPDRSGGSPASGSLAATAKAVPPVSARRMEDLLVSLLPPGTISGRDGRGTDDPLPPYAHVVFDDGHGPAAIEVIVENGGAAPAECSSDAPAGTSCTQSHVHGGTLTVLKTFEYPDHRAETKDWEAVFRTKDGAQVTVNEWNAAAEKGAPVSRPEPPLSAARLGALATSDVWRKVIAATPRADKAGVPGKAGAGTKDGAVPNTSTGVVAG
ncbi:hypothetical protein SAMN05216223_11479 [Actinacidiphila yanglinensis]|uniref:Uncharacterized protein n=1 Tax=Actinacidiphila yanglinensis TaxID=310779 RepID=A0A1H6DDX4_9ACTN|nr:hypothetical protein [Actinacidiphila yanglinensis]SEG83440.1 hypothetical protein SAMN05216223_11479 [Actinacidiphila yanglinensis]